MQQLSEESELFEYFANAGEIHANELEVLGATIRSLTAENSLITNKSIIIHLIGQMERTNDAARLDAMRKTLELVVGLTPDDPEV
ncbi:biofilm development regulator YmgB/AriR family protein [Rouxiella chamberiensis]|uniref:Biofilm development regulator YmgB/AriR family protein n=1 Tax=Rouxiella chamberiensis TaxID=1513468 RepID=A0ABY7HRT3_9GAMM|nr:biofilm development regulator YmgB/AriR family protein [Rouxiella chamberiensis]WAT02114.1 biofilm development regulator YmgB/AriR family protein [Rouxiella chamberiensis]